MVQDADIVLGTPVVVDWLDAAVVTSGWATIDKRDFRPQKVRSFGFLLNRDHQSVTIAADGNPKKPLKDDVNRVLTIPAGMVVYIAALTL